MFRTRGMFKNTINHVLIINTLKDVEAMREVDVGSDHYLVRAEFKITKDNNLI